MTSDTGSGHLTYILVHGIGVSSRCFERLIPVTSRRARVIAIDLPGFGTSPKPPVAMTVEDFANSLATLLDDLGLTGCILVGHSMGSQIATRLALVRPDLVTAVALIGPVVDPRDRNAVRSALLLGRDTIGESPRANWLVLTDYLRCGLRWYLSVLPSMLGYPIEDELPRLRCPVTVIRGEGDPIARAPWTAMLSASAASGETHTIPRARHLAMHAQPELTDTLLSDLAVRTPEPRPTSGLTDSAGSPV